MTKFIIAFDEGKWGRDIPERTYVVRHHRGKITSSYVNRSALFGICVIANRASLTRQALKRFIERNC